MQEREYKGLYVWVFLYGYMWLEGVIEKKKQNIYSFDNADRG